MPFFTGELSDIRVLGSALTDDEVLDLYEEPCLDCDEDPQPEVVFVRGDSNSSGVVDLTDGVNTLNFLFIGGSSPACLDAADADDSGALAITDAVLTFGYLFLGERPPNEPTPSATTYTSDDCGVDPDEESPDLSCLTLAGTCQ